MSRNRRRRSSKAIVSIKGGVGPASSGFHEGRVLPTDYTNRIWIDNIELREVMGCVEGTDNINLYRRSWING